jgi:hypothetical protein
VRGYKAALHDRVWKTSVGQAGESDTLVLHPIVPRAGLGARPYMNRVARTFAGFILQLLNLLLAYIQQILGCPQ